MTVHKYVIQEVVQSQEGSQIGAFFDFDGTIIDGYSAGAFFRERILAGDVSLGDIGHVFSSALEMRLGDGGFSDLLELVANISAGASEESFVRLGEDVYEKHVAKLIRPESRALIEAHLKKGHTVAMITSATPYQVQAAARDLGIENVFCSKFEIDENGRFTGKAVKPSCFGPGKVAAAQAIVDQCGVDLDQSYFYSDSYDDVELLKVVGKPRPLNPDKKLTRLSEQRGWPVRRFHSRGRGGVAEWGRSIAAQLSLPAVALAGLPVWALTGSRQKAVNLSFSLFADLASALIELDLDVEGEQHLWSHRPAVFVFNHQSQADAIILASLLRRDFTGVSKKEAADIPFVGQALKYLGAVFVDRSNTVNAVEAMRPLVDAITVDGKSVVIAPEGTRTVSTKLGKFKKGAFHLAMQANVPIVPVIIHNALDSSPKGDALFYPATVRVSVLPPVDSRGWSIATIDEHIAEVRNLFLQTLGQSTEIEAGPVRRAKPRKKATKRANKKNSKGTGATRNSKKAKPKAGSSGPSNAERTTQ